MIPRNGEIILLEYYFYLDFLPCHGIDIVIYSLCFFVFQDAMSKMTSALAPMDGPQLLHEGMSPW